MVFYLLPLMYLHSIQTYLTKSESKPAANFWSNDSILLSRRPDSVISFAWYSQITRSLLTDSITDKLTEQQWGPKWLPHMPTFSWEIWKRCSSSCFTFSPDLVALHRWHLSPLDTWGRKIKCLKTTYILQSNLPVPSPTKKSLTLMSTYCSSTAN